VTRRKVPAKRTKRSVGERIGRFWILIVVLSVIAVALAGFAEFWPGFYPKHILVSGNERVDRATILQAALMQSINAMAARVAAIPFVGRVTVRRYPPGTIAIAVTERVPFAMVQRGDAMAIVDDSLRVLGNESDDAALPLFVLSGNNAFVPGAFLHSNDALALRSAYATVKDAALVPTLLEFDRYGQLEVTTADGLHLLLGDPSGLEQKVRLCSAILAQTTGQRRKLATIDVRAPGTPVVTYAVHR
jgi:cell division septal protein FtsQ